MRRLLTLILTALLGALLAGCGTGSGGGDGDSGEVIIGLTDAEGDFHRYEVDVLSIQLTRSDGTLVETLPLVTRVDFAELTELTEFVTAATIPLGLYTEATMTLDYMGADIEVEDADGLPTPADVLGPDGESIDTLDVTVQFDNRRALRIAPGVPAHLTLDFDLDATNDVDTTQQPPVVTVQPLLIAEVNPERPKVHRVRGPLLSVDESNQTFVLAIRPFRVRRDFGRLPVETAPDTVYEVDGRTAEGDEGFALLAAKPLGTGVVAVGDLDVPARTFRAREVYAGSSVPGGELDALSGTVIARVGETLTVRGRALDREGSVTFNVDVEVAIGEETSVTRQGDPGSAPTIADISVGQHLTILGEFDPRALTLDATQGHVRLRLTRITGTAVKVRPPEGDVGGEIDIDIQHIQGRRVEAFDFTGTGVAPEDDADPDQYTVATGNMTLASLEIQDPVRIFGFVTPFGSAPPDFEARSIADASEAVARLRVRWLTPGADALSVDPSSQTLTLGLAGVGPLHHVFRNGIAVELAAEPPTQIIPADDRGLFAIRKGRPTRVFGSFDEFARALIVELEGAQVTYVAAHGDFDDDIQVFTAQKVVVRLR